MQGTVIHMVGTFQLLTATLWDRFYYCLHLLRGEGVTERLCGL